MSGSRCRKPEKKTKGQEVWRNISFKEIDERQKCKINIKKQYLGNTGK